MGCKIYMTTAKKDCENNQDPEVLRAFQKTLKQIPKWNQDVIGQRVRSDYGP